MATEPLTTEIRVEGAEEGRKTLAEFFNAFKEGQGDVEALTKEMREQASTIYGARRALMLIRTEWRMQHAAWIEGARLMRDIGRIGRNITQMWQAYTIGMIRVENAQRDLRQATIDVADAQRRYNRYLEVFGDDSVYTIDAFDDLTEAIERQKDAQDRLDKANQAMIIGYVGIGLQTADIIASIPMMIMHMYMLRQTMIATGTSAVGLASSMGLIAFATAGVIVTGAALIEWLTKGDEAFGMLGEKGRKTYGELEDEALAYFGTERTLAQRRAAIFYAMQKNMEESIKLMEGWGYSSGHIEEVTAAIEELYDELGKSEEAFWAVDDATIKTIDDIMDVSSAATILAGVYKDLGYSAETVQENLKAMGETQEFINDVMKAMGAEPITTTPIGDLKYGVLPPSLRRQLGGEVLETGYYHLLRGEKITPTTRVKGRGDVGVRQVRITNYFGDVVGTIDLEHAGEVVYRKLMRKMEAVR